MQKSTWHIVLHISLFHRQLWNSAVATGRDLISGKFKRRKLKHCKKNSPNAEAFSIIVHACKFAVLTSARNWTISKHTLPSIVSAIIDYIRIVRVSCRLFRSAKERLGDDLCGDVMQKHCRKFPCKDGKSFSQT